MPTDIRGLYPRSMLNNGPSFHCLTTLILIILPVIFNTTSETHLRVLHHRGKRVAKMTNLAPKAAVVKLKKKQNSKKQKQLNKTKMAAYL